MPPLFSIIIPVWREAGLIEAQIRHLRCRDMAARAEIIVVDGEAQATTIARLREQRELVTICAPAGRARQMNAGAQKARGDILLFVHVDTRLHRQALPAAARCLRSPGVDAGAFDLGIDAVGSAYRLIEKTVYYRSRLFQLPYGDQGIFIRRHVFDRLGGFRDMALMEDVDLVRRLKRTGTRIGIVPLAVHTSARRWQQEGVLRCTLRNWLLMTLFHAGVSASRLARWYPPPARS